MYYLDTTGLALWSILPIFTEIFGKTSRPGFTNEQIYIYIYVYMPKYMPVHTDLPIYEAYSTKSEIEREREYQIKCQVIKRPTAVHG